MDSLSVYVKHVVSQCHCKILAIQGKKEKFFSSIVSGLQTIETNSFETTSSKTTSSETTEFETY